MNYPQAKADYQNRIQYQSGKYEGARLENNTRLVQREHHGIECYAVKLHNTDIVTYFPNGLVMLNTGGWYTVTTKRRINKYYDGPDIVQVNYEWYIGGGPKYGGTLYREAISERDMTGTPLFRSHRVYFMKNRIVETDENGTPASFEVEPA